MLDLLELPLGKKPCNAVRGEQPRPDALSHQQLSEGALSVRASGDVNWCEKVLDSFLSVGCFFGKGS